MTDNRSYKVWIVQEHGYEHSDVKGLFTLGRVADLLAERLRGWHKIDVDSTPSYVEPLTFTVRQIDLVTHDGAHAIHEALQSAVRMNR